MAVMQIDVVSRTPYAGGRAFGDGGAYEDLRGSLRFAVDPLRDANRDIVDLDKAPRDAAGLVRFRADFRLFQPVDPGRANRRLLYLVVNRGRQQMPFNLVSAPAALAPPLPTAEVDPGDAFLMRRGWTVAWSGWQWDVVDDPALIGFEAPSALGPDGAPLQGQVAVQFQPNSPYRFQLLAHWPLHPPPGMPGLRHRPYPAADVGDPAARLLVRDTPDGPRTEIPRQRWRFAREEGGEPVPDDSYVWLEEGFAPGRLYEVVYRTRACPIVGTGLLAVRDCVSFLRYGGGDSGNPAAGRIAYTYGFGASQCGRFLRHFLSLGLNLDEAGRRVFDGLIPHVAGARRGEFNHRFAQPSVMHQSSEALHPPFSDEPQRDTPGNEIGGLLDTQRRRGGVPKIFTINTSSEYWRIQASLTHTTLSGTRDAEPPPEVRSYLLAGTQHNPGVVPQPPAHQFSGRGANGFNTVNFSPLMRAALVNLDRWVADGEVPPPSAIPHLADGTAMTREQALETFRARPGVALPAPELLPVLRRDNQGVLPPRGGTTVPNDASVAYPCFVSAVDDDGNEVAGIRLPDLTVPLAAHTGWNPRHAATGGEGQIVDIVGSTLPFLATPHECERRGDPRPSIAERYRNRDDYLARVEAAAQQLVTQRYLLAEDVDAVLAHARERYDYFTRRPDAFEPAAEPSQTTATAAASLQTLTAATTTAYRE